MMELIELLDYIKGDQYISIVTGGYSILDPWAGSILNVPYQLMHEKVKELRFPKGKGVNIEIVLDSKF